MVIPESIINEINENSLTEEREKTENVLILAMSVLYLNKQTISPEEYKYQDQAGEHIYYSGSQLVPGSKYIASLLDENGEKLDRIIVINTKETLDEAKTKEGNSFGISAYDYYKKELSAYLRNQHGDHSDESHLNKAYEESEIDNLFVSVNKDEEGLQPDQYLWKIAQTIKEDGSDKFINLYVDTQGGDRNAIVELNAVIDLLRNRDVSVIKRIATDFNRENPAQYIKEVNLQYKTYELFSAMQSFERFGIGDELVDFFNKRKSELIETVQILTESIQLCDMNTFDEAINKLRGFALGEIKTADSRFTIVEQDIIGNYKDILGNIKAGDRILFEEIRWCMKKGYLQQALTLIESKALKEVYCSELLYWEPDEQVSDVKIKDKKTYQYNACIHDISQKNSIINAKNRWEDIINYSLVQWCQKCLTNPDYNTGKAQKDLFLFDDDFRSAYIRLKGLDIDKIPYSIPDEPHNISLKWAEERGTKEYEGVITYLFDKKNKELFKFLRLHMALKNQRNTINHASDDSQRRNTYEDIKNAIGIYLELADQLFTDRPNKRKVIREKELFTFQPEKLTKTKKGFRGRLVENDAPAMLIRDNMIGVQSKEAMEEMLKEKKSFTVRIIGGSAIPGVHMVKQIR